MRLLEDGQSYGFGFSRANQVFVKGESPADLADCADGSLYCGLRNLPEPNNSNRQQLILLLWINLRHDRNGRTGYQSNKKMGQ